MAHVTPQATLRYSMFIKRALVESLQAGFQAYTDPTLAAARVAVDFDQRRWKAPGVIIKFNDTEVNNIGVGHEETLVAPENPDPTNPTLFIKYHHRLYKGTVTFEVYGMSSVDRDIVRDGLIEIIGMTDTSNPGDNFISRFNDDQLGTPYGIWHYPVLNTDLISGGGEQVGLAPWLPEDTLVYSVSYSIPIIGEFYSNTPTLPSGIGLVEGVDVYPWIEGIDLTPIQNPDYDAHGDPNPDWYRFTGWTETQETI